MSLLHQLLDLVLLKGIDERLQGIRHLFQSRVWDKIKGGKKFMELTAFYARMSRDNLLRDKVDLNEAFESKDFIVTNEEIYNNEEPQRELLNHQLKDLPLLGNKMRQWNWISSSRAQEHFIKTKETLIDEYLQDVHKSYEGIKLYIDHSVKDQEERKKTKDFFNMLSEIEEENKNRSQKFFHIIHSNWKYSFGTEESWKAKLPKDLLNSIPTCEMEFNDLSSDFLNFKNSLSQRLEWTQQSMSKSKKKSSTKQVNKKEIKTIVRILQRKRHKIKKQLHDMFEDKLLNSLESEDKFILGSSQSQSLMNYESRLEMFLMSIPEPERSAFYYFLEDEILEKLPQSICEKGKAIKKLVSKELDYLFDYGADNLEEEFSPRIHRRENNKEEARPAEEIFTVIPHNTTEENTKATSGSEFPNTQQGDYASDEEEKIENRNQNGVSSLQKGPGNNRNDYASDNGLLSQHGRNERVEERKEEIAPRVWVVRESNENREGNEVQYIEIEFGNRNNQEDNQSFSERQSQMEH